MRRHRVAVAATALALLAACGGGGASGEPAASDGSLPPIATEDCPAERDLLTPEQAAAAPGLRLPEVTLACIGSQRRLPLHRLGGRPAVINLWASWCLPCKKEMPALQSVYPAARERGVRFLGINVNDSSELAARRTIQDTGVAFPQVRAPRKDLLNAVRVPGPPVTLFVDARGTIVHREVGELSAAEIRRQIREHLGVDVAPAL